MQKKVDSSVKRLAYKPTVLPNSGNKISPLVSFIKEILNQGPRQWDWQAVKNAE